MTVGGVDLVAYRALMLCADCGRHVGGVCISHMNPREGVGGKEWVLSRVVVVDLLASARCRCG